ncbi:hypothetical protein LBMAG42_00580 [Deltaproteobacteria bacterium]|nr:hypothetical protein LBMAG42_00580 [Deltaproteobacteria bacterium]
MVLALYIACAADPAPPTSARWPVPGEVAIVEVSAALDGNGHATAWSAEAWTTSAELVAVEAGGCSELLPHAHGSLAAVDLSAPAAARLTPEGEGPLRSAGPLSARDARWQVGNVSILRDDGTRADFEGALRFGDAPQVLAVRTSSDGAVTLRVGTLPGERVEIDAVNPAGKRVRCLGGDDGTVELPWSAVDPSRPVVTVRAVRDTLSHVRNVAVVRVRSAIEATLSLDEPLFTEHSAPRPPAKPATWEPRKVLRYRASWG